MNQQRRVGLFDDNDGVFWNQNGTGFGICIRSSVSGLVVDTPVAQSAWNIDKMDGSGPSGTVLDVTRGNIYEIDLQWLGVGTVNFFINGQLVHSFLHANLLSVPYMRTALLPLSWEVVNTGASAIGSLTGICASVVSESGQTPPDLTFGARSPASTISAETAMLAIRPAATFQGRANRILVLPTQCSVSTEVHRASSRVIYNPSLVGAVWNAANAQSGVEFATTFTSFSGGQEMQSLFMSPNTGVVLDLMPIFGVLSRKLRLRSLPTTSQDVLLVTGTDETGGGTSMRASVAWKEVR